MTRTPLPTPTLRTARLRLRPFSDTDADGLFALHSNAYVLRYWDAPPWGERVRAEQFITACRRMAEEGTGARLAVDRVFDGTFIGWCSLTRWNPGYRSASLGYCFTDAAWGHGYATEAARVLLRWAFGTLDLNRVQAETDTRNLASARVLEKLGFVREGTLREDCVVNGEVSDSWVYGLIKREWRPSPEPAGLRWWHAGRALVGGGLLGRGSGPACGRVVGACYLVTALALRPAGTAGRLILITGAVAGMLVAANPERAGDVYPWGHIIWALWPLVVVLSCGARPDSGHSAKGASAAGGLGAGYSGWHWDKSCHGGLSEPAPGSAAAASRPPGRMGSDFGTPPGNGWQPGAKRRPRGTG